MKVYLHNQEFEVSAPFAEGHVLTAQEAEYLNVQRASAVRESARRALAEILFDKKGAALTGAALEKALVAGQKIMDSADKSYILRAVLRAPVEQMSELEQIALSIAKTEVNAALKANGYKVRGNTDKLAEFYEKYAKEPATIAKAEEELARRKAAPKVNINELLAGIGNVLGDTGETAEGATA